MDTAVAIVQSYLHINGYFTVTEFPIVEAMHLGHYRAATDIDILAVRFPASTRLVPMRGRIKADEQYEHDSELSDDPRAVDMIIGEVKEGPAELNRGARDPVMLRTVLTRFGCCPQEHVGNVIENLLHTGRAAMPTGHQVRLVAFGAARGEPLGYPCKIVSLSHVITYTREYLRQHWDILRHAQFKDVALSFLLNLEKADADST